MTQHDSPGAGANPADLDVDVLIVGTGPVGCTYARKLYDAGRSVYMVDTGAAISARPGEHLKNAFLYQRNVDQFSSVIRGHLHVLSVPTNLSPVLTLDPAGFSVDVSKYPGTLRNNQNPNQDPFRNLPAAAASYGVGGMATHWTCATPRQHPTIERSTLLSETEWDRLYTDAEALLNTRSDQFAHSIRGRTVLDLLQREYSELRPPYQAQWLPLAVQRRQDNDELVRWSGADTILGPLAEAGGYDGSRFVIKPQHRCTRLVLADNGTTIDHAQIDNLIEWQTIRVRAKAYVVAAGAVLTPQILFNSGIRPAPLGSYLSEQPMAFCQIVLKQSVVDEIGRNPTFAEAVAKHHVKNPRDPVPIPMNDPEPQVWIPVSEGRPWHCQIHRDAFAYGDLAPNVDSRLIVDLRWFGIVGQRPENGVTFSDEYNETFGMPQPTFEFQLNMEEREWQHAMMLDMLRAAGTLGGFLPGSEPSFVAPGLTLHIHGTTRIGDDPRASVADVESKVWGFDNLFVGGNGNHPVGEACNPTLTSVALAIKSAAFIAART